MTINEVLKRIDKCPYRQVGQILGDISCTRYQGRLLPCDGACAWVADYPKVKEKRKEITMTKLQEIRKRFGMDSRVIKVKCYKCGKELEAPRMFSEKERDAVLKPYCCASTVLTTQWLIYHGWHVTKHEATPSGAYLCHDCYEGQPEFSRQPYCEDWCKQAEAWMKANEGKR